MTYKLNLDFTELNKTDEQKKIEKVNAWAKPVGWWQVTTEGDEEGKSSRDLGKHYGHLAEIAFHLADKCFYSLQFHTVQNAPDPLTVPVTYVAKKREVSVSFWGESPFFLNSVKGKEPTLQKWLDADGVRVKSSNYYASVNLVIDFLK